MGQDHTFGGGCEVPHIRYRVTDEVPGGQLTAYVEPAPGQVELLIRSGHMTEEAAEEATALANEVIKRCGWHRGA